MQLYQVNQATFSLTRDLSQAAILGQNTTLRGLGSMSHPRNRSELPQPFLFAAVLTTMTSSRR